MFGSTRTEPVQHDPADALVREVGAQLRRAREERGETIEGVAEKLRIRASYLHGLEEGDLSVMPGRAYALGFLRSYAQYLGFDGEDLIAQIRSSVAGLTSEAHLHGRSPLAESRLPKLPILVISLAALAGIYAGWAYVDDRSRAEIELVAEVPDELQQQTTTPPPETVRTPADPPDTPPATATPEILPGIAPPPEFAHAQPVEPRAGATDHTAAQEEPEADTSGSPAAAAASPPLTEQRETAVSEVAMPEAGQSEPTETSTPAATPPPEGDQVALAGPEPPPGEQDTADSAESSAAEDVLSAIEPAADNAAPTTYRADAASRVLLRARTRAWVHVSSTNNDYLWVRTLQPGEAFAVPDRPDLVLWTGNAGGIEVLVDGTPLAPLGPEAGVVRDVSLRPQALLRRLSPAPAARP